MSQNNDYENENVTSKRRVLFIKDYRRLIYELAYSYQ